MSKSPTPDRPRPKYCPGAVWNIARILLIALCAYQLWQACLGSMAAARILYHPVPEQTEHFDRMETQEEFLERVALAHKFLHGDGQAGPNWLMFLTILALTPYRKMTGKPSV